MPKSTRPTPMANNRIHKMTLDTETLSTLSSADRVSTIAKHLKSIPLAQRAGVMKTVQRGLKEREAARLTYNWSLHARDSQLLPEGDWDTWLILAGRVFGKNPHRSRVGPRSGGKQAGTPHRPRRAHPRRSSVRHDRRRVRHRQHIPALGQTHLRAVQAKAHLAQRSACPGILFA